MTAPRQRRWVRVTIRLEEPLQDALIGILATLGFEGFVQESISVECYVAASGWKSLQPHLEDSLSSFTTEFHLNPLTFSVATLKEQNWNRKWEAQTGIVEATPKTIIKPSWKPLRKKDRGKTVLHIDPKMSFGTGHHETTRLCLAMLEQYLHPGDTVLDLGTGTGVLAIAAAKFGAKKVFGIDNDPWSIDNAQENVQRNRVGRTVTIRLGSVENLASRRFDVVVANIDLPTISSVASTLDTLVKTEGFLLLSGILTTDASTLTSRIRSTFTLVETRTDGEWTSFAFQRS